MREDIEYLMARNARLSRDAYSYLEKNAVDLNLLRYLEKTEVAIISLEDIRQAISYLQKIPAAQGNKKDAGQAASDLGPEAFNGGEKVYSHKAQNEANSREGGAGDLETGSGRIKFGAAQAPENLAKKEIGRLEENAQEPANGALKEKAQIPNAAKNGLEKNSDAEAPKIEIVRPAQFHPLAKEYAPKIKINSRRDVSGQSRCMGSVDDFVAYFRDRYKQTTAILKTRACTLPLFRLDQVAKNEGANARVIAMVSQKRMTAKGNIFLEIEDEYGFGKAIIGQKEKCFKEAQNILLDDVIAIDGKISQDFIIANSITWPDIPIVRQEKKVEEDVAIAYLSDLHIGSRYFLERPFKRFLGWLKGEEKNSELASKVKYIVIAGDIVDGIGVYPSQEKELTIKDIYAQYAAFDEIAQSLPDYIEVILGPGNHDAVRRGEPQPYIPMDMVKADVKKIGSPSSLEIEGMNHLVYHGTSLDSMISNMSGLSYAKPEGPMLEMLKRRHLSPIYGENLIVPELRDFMVISDEPDILHMGHIHKNASMKYRGTLMINSGTFQDRTDFQAKMGHIPTPGVVPVLELKSGQLSHLKFAGDVA